jgi:serine/threonine-protein kinase RsbW
MAAPNGSVDRAASAPETAAAPGSELRWRHVFPGDERQLRALRRWLESLLPVCAARDATVTVAVELATNAVQWTASGRGGRFALEITWYGQAVRVTVADGGAPTGPRLIDDPMSEHGRGLLMVRELSARIGVTGDQRGRLVWAEIPWTGEGAVRPGSFPADYEAAIRQDQATLAQRFAGVPVWFGRSTLQWWALPGWAADRLLTAPSARELAELLDRMLPPGQGPRRMAAEDPGAVRAGDRVSVPEAPMPPRIHWSMPRVSRLGAQPC